MVTLTPNGKVRVIACIEAPVMIQKFLDHLPFPLPKAGHRLALDSADAIPHP